MTWEAFYQMAKTFGVPIALLMVGCIALFWMWRQERSENRTLNAELMKNFMAMTEAMVGHADVQAAVKEFLRSVDNRLEKLEDNVNRALPEHRRNGGKAE